MVRKTKLLICSLFACLALAVLPCVKSNAEEMSEGTQAAGTSIQDENSQRLEETTVMDAEGNIYEAEDTEGIVEDADAGIAVASKSARAQVMVVNFNTKGNEVTTYVDEATGTEGYTNGAFGADAAYLGMSGEKVRFMLSGVIGTVDASEVELIEYSAVSGAVSYYTVSGGKLIHYVSQNLKEGKYSSMSNGPAPAFLNEGGKYYSYDGHYFYSDYEAMQSDYENHTRANAVNASAPFYNYYQYLPFRSQSSYAADKLNAILAGRISGSSKLKDTGASFTKYQDTYGVNALLSLSIAANESAWGTSSICQEKNNLFGINAVDTSPGTSAYTFESVDECIRQFMSSYMSAGYLKPSDWRYYGGFLGNKASGVNVKYASDPYWGEKAANIAWNLDADGGNADGSRYTIGIKGTQAEDYTSVNVRQEASTSAAVLYQTKAQPAYAVVVLDGQAADGFYRIQSDAVLSEGRGETSEESTYSFSGMYAYISADYVAVVSTGNGSVPVPDQKPEVDEPITDAPGTGSPGFDIPEEPETSEPEVNEPETNEPETNEPEVNEPEEDKPEANEPEVNEPEANEPEVNRTESGEEKKTENLTVQKQDNNTNHTDTKKNPETVTKVKAPKTGDSANMLLWASMIGISGVLAAAVLLGKKYRQ